MYIKAGIIGIVFDVLSLGTHQTSHSSRCFDHAFSGETETSPILFFEMGHSYHRPFKLSSFLDSEYIFFKNCRFLYLNPRFMVWEAIILPTVLQPLSSHYLNFLLKIDAQIWIVHLRVQKQPFCQLCHSPTLIPALGGVEVVSVLVFYSDNSSWNPTEFCNF